MRPRTVVCLLILSIVLVTVGFTMLVLFVPQLRFPKTQITCDTPAKMQRASPHTDAAAVAAKEDGAAAPPLSPFLHATPAAAVKTAVLAQGRHLPKPIGFPVVAVVLGFLLLWLLRTTGILLPALIAASALAALVVPLGHRTAPTETGGPTCGLSAICRLTETARTNVHLRMELAGLPEPYVKHVGRLLALLQGINCDRVEQSCSRISFSDLLPF
ncbi:uncharacterized protein [Dermacentor andersoni]|uniref:uncharacterized protein n=1 Tax=Dermacentor andersoni TaxID=34620 RepID=UPI002155052A|nr:uncharacterized protein LOC126527269 [Dermacentor andersoni]